jgi:sugar fermentation stimulation protein A
MKLEGSFIEGRFITRLNRFEAHVEINGRQELAHVPNTGRLRELLVPGANLLLRCFDSKTRKTAFGLLLVQKDGLWVSIDSANVPNRIVHDALLQGDFPFYAGCRNLNREVVAGQSRFDFGLQLEEQVCFIEVKGVTLVYDRVARFPDAPTLRGTRHLEELTVLKLEGRHTGVIFIIQREDADVFMPNDDTDKDFCTALRKAKNAGVDMWAYTCRVNPQEIRLDREIPVVL